MPELTAAERHAFLAAADAGHVLTSEHDNQVYLELPGDPPVLVSDKAEALADAGLLIERADSIRWELTDAGRAAMERGAS